MGDLNIDQRVKEFDLPIIHPPEDYQYEKSKKYRRKRRCINPTFMPELRIMRHDIRRKYGDMFVNVSNNRDIGLMTKFVDEFLRPDCVIDRLTPANRNIAQICRLANSSPGIDIERFLYGFAMSCEMTPDKVHRLQECQIRTRQGSQGSIILLKAVVNCVQVFTTNSLQKDQKEEHELQNDENVHSISSVTSSNNSFENIPPTLPTDIKCLTLLNSPVETVALVSFLIILDENHFIRHIHIEDKLISEKLIDRSSSL
mmetsp:Transcript_8431/g.9204  ORF Transcript_8431/g.9204 Transcript_8431/m.9204 type:complete len:257 (+) Transcript_8431:207-977(+)